MLKRYASNRPNPWELLAIAALLFLPGVYMLLQRKPMIGLPLGAGSGRDPGPMYGIEIISPDVAHLFGAAAIFFAAVFVGLYVYLRRVSTDDPPPHVVEHGHDRI